MIEAPPIELQISCVHVTFSPWFQWNHLISVLMVKNFNEPSAFGSQYIFTNNLTFSSIFTHINKSPWSGSLTYTSFSKMVVSSMHFFWWKIRSKSNEYVEVEITEGFPNSKADIGFPTFMHCWKFGCILTKCREIQGCKLTVAHGE